MIRLVAPSRGRGLKLIDRRAGDHGVCRPFTGAWIETLQIGDSQPAQTVAPSRGRGLKQRDLTIDSKSRASPLHGGVD